MMNHGGLLPRLQQPAMRLLLAELEFGPATIGDLCAVVPRVKRALILYLNEARRAKLIHICGWERSRGAPRPVYSIGPGRGDAVRPQPLTGAERTKRSKDRKTMTNGNVQRGVQATSGAPIGREIGAHAGQGWSAP